MCIFNISIGHIRCLEDNRRGMSDATMVIYMNDDTPELPRGTNCVIEYWGPINKRDRSSVTVVTVIFNRITCSAALALR